MSCLNPYSAWQDLLTTKPNGKNPIIIRKKHDRIPNIVLENPDRFVSFQIPCGKCVLCRKTRALEIAIRARCEAASHEVSCFVTLTCSDDNLPLVFPGGKLHHRAFQLFFKRLRKRLGIKKLRYLMCGEYGSNTHRPHYHVIIFGWSPTDIYWDDLGFRHDSRILEECWPYGHVRCDELNDNRIFYVAGYTLKESPGFPSYVKWSRRPGLGLKFFEEHWQGIYKKKVSWIPQEDGTLYRLKGFASEYFVGRRMVNSSIRYFNQKMSLLSPEKYVKLSYAKLEYGQAMQRASPLEIKHGVMNLKKKAVLLEHQLASKSRDANAFHLSDTYKELTEHALCDKRKE